MTIPEPHFQPTSPRVDRLVVAAVFAFSLTWALGMAGVGWDHTLSDDHGWRQAQTAIVSDRLLGGGPFLAYETPFVGAPWSIPQEFPLYQWLVAKAVGAFGTRLVPTGRWIGEVFFYLGLVAAWPLLGELGVRPLHRLVFFSLMLLSPLYLFWSRGFLFESTAVAFGMAYLLFAVRHLRTRRGLDAVLGCLMGVLASLVKAPSVPGFALLVLVLFARDAWACLRQGGGLAWRLQAVRLFAFGLVPLFVCWIWTRHADQVRSLNVLGASLVLQAWRFAPWSARFNGSLWRVLFDRTLPDVLGHAWIAPVVVLALPLAPRRKAAAAICALAFVAVILAFPILHGQHNYYAYANGLFLVAAVSWWIVALLESGQGLHRLLGHAVFLTCGIAMATGYYWGFHGLQRVDSTALATLGQTVRSLTRPEDVIVGFGLDWDPQLPFYAERRALMWPSVVPYDLDTPMLRGALANLQGLRVGLLVTCNEARDRRSFNEALARSLGLGVEPVYRDRLCDLRSPPELQARQGGPVR
jgi:hypothetical protein